jgi:glutathione peroxidase
MKKSLLMVLLFGLGIGSAQAVKDPENIYGFKVNTLSGDAITLSKFKGKPLLIVNTASHCGYTPQYQGLQAIYQKYQAQGFEILAFPSNDFGQQEPGSAKEIKSFCETKYKVSFPLFEKNPVSGKLKQPLYDWLINHESGKGKSAGEVEWNFEKFLISKDGKVLARFRSGVEPESAEMKNAIEAALKK